MDQRLRELEIQVRQGDVSAALQYEQHRRRVEGPRERQPSPIHRVSINTRRMQGELQLTIESSREIEFNNWQVPAETGGQEDVPLYVNGVPHSIQFTFHNFEEYGWQPTSLARLQQSQQEREQQRKSWNLNRYLAGAYGEDDIGSLGGAQPNIYIRRTDRAFNRGDPTRNARNRIMALGRELAETWPQEHPEEMQLAHKIFLNNEIITQTAVVEELQTQIYGAMNNLASLIAADLD